MRYKGWGVNEKHKATGYKRVVVSGVGVVCDCNDGQLCASCDGGWVMGENLIFTYDNFPCIEPLAQGMESETARLLYETVGPVPMEKLEKVCKNRSTMYVIVSTLRGKLTPGHRIFKSKDGYQLVYDGDVLLKEDNGVLPQARVKLGQRIQALRSSIEAINGELQRLNARKVDVKRQLEIAEVGLLALEELEDCDDSNT